jgi:hypothetical protein
MRDAASSQETTYTIDRVKTLVSTPGIKAEIIIVCAAPIAFGLWALALGQDSNWDLLNYHYYNPYAFLTHRLGWDFAPAQRQTFYNPLLDVPYFWMTTQLPPRMTGFLLGALQGINFCLLFAICKKITARTAGDYKFAVALALALAGVAGAANISELGTVMGDNIVSLFVLGALLILLARRAELIAEPFGPALATALTAGFSAGLGGGLKLPSLIFSFGFTIGMFALAAGIRRKMLLASAYSAGVAAGVVATSGFWFYQMWLTTGNPVFPYFNYVFQSPLADMRSYRDFRFLPTGAVEAAVYPLVFLFNPLKVAEVAFRDLRIPLLYLASLGFAVQAVLARLSAKASTEPSDHSGMEGFLLVGIASAYIVWLKLFAIYRYLVVLEMLAPIVLWIVIVRTPIGLRGRIACISAVGLLLLATTQPMNWGRKDWSDRYFAASVPGLAAPEKSLVLMAGRSPLSYLVPLFPPPVRFVRLESNFYRPSRGPRSMNQRLRALISAHEGPLYLLFDRGEERRARFAGEFYGLTISENDCTMLESEAILNRLSVTKFCGLRKQSFNTISRPK